ncbi:MAG: hypothetical protein ABIR32_12070 [Ilumatobacteraceae bacterium]
MASTSHIRAGVERALRDVGDEQRVHVDVQVARATLEHLREIATVDPLSMIDDPVRWPHRAAETDETPSAILLSTFTTSGCSQMGVAPAL